MTHPGRSAERVEVVFVVLTDRVVEVEADCQGAIEEPGLREADHALLGLGARTDARRGVPAAAEEVPLGDVDTAEKAVDGREAAADREDAGGPLDDVDVHDDLRLVGAGRRVDVHGLEEAEVDQALARALHFLEGEELALLERNFAPQALVLAAHVADGVVRIYL